MCYKPMLTQKKKKLAIDLTSFIKVNSKWVIDINVKHLEENIGESLSVLQFVVNI